MALYETLAARIESAGFFTSIQPRTLVCATDGGSWGIGGHSLWVMERDGRWFIATWVPRVYEIKEAVDIAELVGAALMVDTGEHLYAIREAVQRQYSLRELTLEEESEFDAASERELKEWD